MDPDKLVDHLEEHNHSWLMGEIERELHVSLSKKESSNTGDGSGVWVDGPRSGQEVQQLLQVMNHTRNGYAHKNPIKVDKIPKYFSGVLWVAGKADSAWTVQKPHAMSSLRAAEVIYRHLVYSIWGKTAAIAARSALPQFYPVRLNNDTHQTSIEEDVKGLIRLIEGRDGPKSVAALDDIRCRLVANKWSSDSLLFENEVCPVLFDAIQFDPKCQNVLTTEGTYIPSQLPFEFGA